MIFMLPAKVTHTHTLYAELSDHGLSSSESVLIDLFTPHWLVVLVVCRWMSAYVPTGGGRELRGSAPLSSRTDRDVIFRLQPMSKVTIVRSY